MTMTIGNQDHGLNYVSVTDSAGIACRVYLPKQTETAAAPLILWSHPNAHDETIAPNYPQWPLLHSCLQEGWMVAASNMHGNSWGNASALTDLNNLRNLCATYRPVSKVVLVGGSMGGLATANAVSKNSVPNVVGALVIDGVFNLDAIYKLGTFTTVINNAYLVNAGTLSAASSAGATSISSSVSFPAGTSILIDPQGANPETVTTTGAATGAGPYTIPVPALGFAHASGVPVSDFPAKSAGYDPMVASTPSLAGIPWRFYVGASDTTVPTAPNSTQFATKIAAAPEKTVVTHFGTHLSRNSMDVPAQIAFIKRCLA